MRFGKLLAGILLVATVSSALCIVMPATDADDDGTWSSGETVTVTIVKITMVIDRDRIETKLVEDGKPFTPQTPIYGDHQFNGWMVYRNGYLAPQTDVIHGDTTFIASWEGLSVVYFDMMGHGEDIIQNDVGSDRPLSVPIPSVPGYIFDGWYTHDGDDERIFDGAGDIGDFEYVYSKWTKAHVVTLDFNIDGIVNYETVADNSTVSLPTEAPVQYYTIHGWYTDRALTQPFVETTPITGDIRLYADTSYDPPHIHIWADPEVVYEPTCEKPGKKRFHCECGETMEESIPRLSPTGEHTWDAGTVTKEPTLRTEGEMTYVCTVCDSRKTEAIPRLECTHTWDGREIIEDPTCANPGKMQYMCNDCGDVKIEEIPATREHTWDEGHLVDSSSDIIRGHRCTGCGVYMTSVESWTQNSFTNQDGSVRTVTFESYTESAQDGTSKSISHRTITTVKDGKVIETITQHWESSGDANDSLSVHTETVEKDGKTEETIEISAISSNGDVITEVVAKNDDILNIDANIKNGVDDSKISDAIRQTERLRDMIGDHPSDIRARISVEHGTKVSPASIDALRESDCALVIGSIHEKGTLCFTNDALDRLYEVGENMLFIFNYADYDRMTEPMKDRLGDIGHDYVYDIGAWNGDKELHDWSGLENGLDISFKIPSYFKDPTVFWLNDDGNTEVVPYYELYKDSEGDWIYRSSMDHLSTYFIAEGENADGEGGRSHIYAGALVVIIVAVAAVAIFRRR